MSAPVRTANHGIEGHLGNRASFFERRSSAPGRLCGVSQEATTVLGGDYHANRLILFREGEEFEGTCSVEGGGRQDALTQRHGGAIRAVDKPREWYHAFPGPPGPVCSALGRTPGSKQKRGIGYLGMADRAGRTSRTRCRTVRRRRRIWRGHRERFDGRRWLDNTLADFRACLTIVRATTANQSSSRDDRHEPPHVGSTRVSISPPRLRPRGSHGGAQCPPRFMPQTCYYVS